MHASHMTIQNAALELQKCLRASWQVQKGYVKDNRVQSQARTGLVLGQPPSIPSCCPRAWWSATKLRTAMCIVGPCDFPGATCPRQLLLSELQGVGISQRPPRLPGAGHGRGRAHGTGLRVLSARNACVWPAKTHMCTVFSVCACASACAVLWHVPGTAALIFAFFAAKTAKKHFATCW